MAWIKPTKIPQHRTLYERMLWREQQLTKRRESTERKQHQQVIHPPRRKLP